MKIIHRYLCKNFLGPFILTFFVALFVLLMQFLWKWVDELVGKGLEIGLLLRLLFYASLTLCSMAFPLAVLLASLMTFGNMGERYEIVALKSAGISTRRMMQPLAILALAISVIAFIFSNEVVPRATVKLKMMLYDIQEQKPAMNIEEGVFYYGFDDYAIRVGKKMPDGVTVKDVLIYDHSKHQGNTTMTYAKSGKMQTTSDKHYLLFTLEDGFYWDETSRSHSRQAQSRPLMRASFDQQYKRFDISAFSLSKVDESMFQMHSTAMSIKQLNHTIDTLKEQIATLGHGASDAFFGNLYFFNAFVKNNEEFDTMSVMQRCDLTEFPQERAAQILQCAENAARNFIYSVRFSYHDIDYRTQYLWSFQIELFRKFTLSMACLLFFFIGAPLGSIIRKGGIGIPLVITVVFFTFYFALSIIGEKISKSSSMPIWFGMWMSSFILLPICVFLTYHATTDSALFSQDTYSKFIHQLKNKKIFSRKRYEDSSDLS